MRVLVALGAVVALLAGCGESKRSDAGTGGTAATAASGGAAGSGASGGVAAGGAGGGSATSGGGSAGEGGGTSGGGGGGARSGSGGSSGSAGTASGSGGEGGGAGTSTDGGRWVWQSDTATPNDLSCVWVVAADDVWAVGGNGAIVHFDGSGWSTVPSNTKNHLSGIWGTSADDIWAVGGGVGGEPNLVHWDGAAWSVVNAGTTTNLYAVWGSGPDDVFAVGASGIAGVITHFDGDTWAVSFDSDFVAFGSVSGSGAGDVWATGGTLGPHGLGVHAAAHFSSGGPWLPDPSDTFPEASRGLWSFAEDDVWSLGDGEALHWDGTAWSRSPSVLLAGMVDIWGSDRGELTAVGQNATVVEGTSSLWDQARSGGAALASVGGMSQAVRFAVGDRGTILRFEPDTTDVADCAAIGGECVSAGTCAGHLSDYACGGSDDCCVSSNACGAMPPCCGPTDAEVPAICHDGQPYCPTGSSSCPMPP